MAEPALRQSDKFNDGSTVVAQTATTVSINSLPAALVGSLTSKGATIVTGSPSVIIENKPAAIVGSKDSQGHIAVAGSNNVVIG